MYEIVVILTFLQFSATVEWFVFTDNNKKLDEGNSELLLVPVGMCPPPINHHTVIFRLSLVMIQLHMNFHKSESTKE